MALWNGPLMTGAEPGRITGIKGFVPVSLLDWPGKVCAIVFLAGCGFRCPACHNGSLVLNPESLPDIDSKEVFQRIKTRRNWIDGITVTGGEPTCRANLPGFLLECKTRGLTVKLDTNGSNPDMLERLIGGHLVDAVYMDVKAPLIEASYSRVAGVPVNLDHIRRSIRVLKSSRIEVVFRTTVIPGLVEEPELELIGESLGPVPHFRIQAFRAKECLNPAFMAFKEFPLARVELMRRMFEGPRGESVPDRYRRAG
ncbi:MAG: anaerobic ribonucleoside-triphosphate reductase activating protein [Pseudomonadota bacterium]